MKREEIEKLLSMANKKDLVSIKEFLLTEKEKSDNKLRQSTFEEYLRTNKWGLNVKTTPKLYVEEDVQKFTNGVSLYIINKSFFLTNTPKLIKANAKGARANHKFEYVDNIYLENYLSKTLLNFSNIFSECTDYIETREYGKYTFVEYHNVIYNEQRIERFDRKETDWANIILNNPTYYISHNCPILKAESDIGKCYILGYKNNKSN